MIEESENIVKKTCRELGISQKELAEMTGFSEDSISKWNKGFKLPKSAINFFNFLVKYQRFQHLENQIKAIQLLT